MRGLRTRIANVENASAATAATATARGRKKSATRSQRRAQRKVVADVVDVGAEPAVAAAAAESANAVLTAKLEVEKRRATQQRHEFQSLLASQIDGLRALKSERGAAVAALSRLTEEREASETAMRLALEDAEANVVRWKMESSSAASDCDALRAALSAIGSTIDVDDGDAVPSLIEELCGMAAEDMAAALRRQSEHHAAETRRLGAATELRLDALQSKQRALLALVQRERDAALEHQRERHRVAMLQMGSSEHF